MDERLRPTERMHSSGEYRKVFRSGRCLRTRFLRIHYRRNNGHCSRLGLVVTRRMGNAVLRSRLKRLLREVFRRHKKEIKGALDVVLVPQREPRPYAEYVEVFLQFAAGLQCVAPKDGRSR